MRVLKKGFKTAERQGIRKNAEKSFFHIGKDETYIGYVYHNLIVYVFFSERVTRAPFTELRKAQLILTSYREANKYSANGDANDAARIFFSLKPRSITFVSHSSFFIVEREIWLNQCVLIILLKIFCSK